MPTTAFTATSPAGDIVTINSSKAYTHAIFVRDVVQDGDSARWVMHRSTTREALALKQANTWRNVVGYENVVVVPMVAS